MFVFSDTLHAGAFATQPRLLSLNLTNNLLEDLPSGAFANSTRLVRLILTRNRIKRMADDSLAGKTEGKLQ